MKLFIEGMSCDHCKRRVEKALKSIEGVQSAQVNLEDGTATVESSKQLSEATLREAIEEAGYTLKSVQS